ncbi:MAG: hypothetical protein WB755_15895 [Terriglobales bacterium]
MTPRIQVGTILIEDRPLVTQILDLESESYSGNWSVIKAIDGFAFDRKIHAAGWNFFFIAEEVKATVFGSLAARSIQKALKRILVKVRKQDFSYLEVTKMVENRFLGVPYITVCTHPRHIQQGCWLDSAQERAAARQKEIQDSCGTVR